MATLFSDHKYDDIINLPHPVSKTHPPMDILDRAAQFSPFAALTGYEAATKETERLTQQRIELDESEKEILDEQLSRVEAVLKDHPQVTITYFIPDLQKEGGKYHTVTGRVQKIDHYKRIISLENGEAVFMGDILRLQMD